MRKIFVIILFYLFLINTDVLAQACLSDYQYRVPISLTNTNGDELNNFQVKVIINTQDLILAGKLRYDGGDIRFTNSSGTQLSYWFDPSTFNTTTTEFWVKVDNIPDGGNTIYLFYGNPSAAYISSGDATFELFDEFEGTALNGSKWTRCGDISNLTLSGGTIYFNYSLSEIDGVIYSNEFFPSDVIVEADVQNALNGKAVLGLADNLNRGYGTTMDNTGSNIMKLSIIENEVTECQNLVDVLPANTPVIAGVWSFKWPAAASQTISCSGVTQSYTDPTYSAFFGNDKQVIMGTHINATSSSGSFSVDWLRVRKLAVDPIASLGSEEEYPVNPNASNDGPYCGGDTIHFSSTQYSGAVYSWFDTGNILFSSVYNPSLISDPSLSGVYKLEVSVPGCPAVISYTTVDVSQTSVAGTTVGDAVVCSGVNSGIVSVSGITGNIVRWEMANATAGPWYAIFNYNDSISYSNLLQTTYFRPVVKTNSCPEDVGTAAIVTVNSPTSGGFVIGGTSVCSGNNSGTLNLVYSNGDVNKWQKSTDNGLNWTDIINTSPNCSFTNLTTTTLYRAEVQNGSCCPALFSDSAKITVNPLPVPSFSADTVCEGMPSVFVNTSAPSVSSNTYQWDFGNGSSSISTNPVYTYPAPGIYVVGLTATSSAGCVADTSILYAIDPLPNVAFDAVPGCLGSPTVFQAIVSVPLGGSVASYFWDHDNGTTDSIGTHTYLYPASGIYNVMLMVTTNKGCVDSVEHQVEVSSPVNVNFISDSVCLGDYVSFINTSSTGLPTTINYTWDFGNGSTSNLYSPTYSYPVPGSYVVTLQAQTAGSSSSCISTHQDTVLIYDVPQPDFTLGNVCLSDSASFYNTTFYTGTPTDLSYIWAFGDASSDTTVNPVHLYSSPGNFNVTLTVNTITGCSAGKTQLITIYPMPVANFNSDNVCHENNMIFVSTSSVSTGSLTYNWDFGDAGSSQFQNPIHLYPVAGNYDVTLIATTNNNCTDTMTKQVTVYPLPYVDYLNTPVCDGQPSSFSEQTSISSGNVISFFWDFGDGSSSSSSVATHQYSTPGSYNVKLMATSDYGCAHDTVKAVIVTPVPTPNFSVINACLNSPNQFTNSSTILDASPMTYEWFFGDGGTSSLTSPGYIYASSGLFQVMLVASSGPGCRDSVMKYAEVYDLPDVNAGYDTSISKGDEIMLNGYAPSGIYYAWTPLISISNSSIPNPVARPDETTIYILTMTDINGCQNTDEVTITVEDDFKLLIYNVITPDENGQNDYWEIENIDYYPQAKVQIFNRWGEKVYEKTGYTNDWQGTYNNDQLPDGSYYYIISFPDTDFHYKGSITLLRNK